MQADGLQPIDASSTGAATGEDMPKTEGIPNYMIRNTGTVARIAEGPDSATAVLDDGALYESGRLVSLVTSDVIDMVQQQGGAAEAVDYLGENILVEGLLFDDFRAEAVFDVASLDAPDDVVTLEVVEARPSSDLVLAQIAGRRGQARASRASCRSPWASQAGRRGS